MASRPEPRRPRAMSLSAFPTAATSTSPARKAASPSTLYAQQIGAARRRLTAIKYLGGNSANIAFGAAQPDRAAGRLARGRRADGPLPRRDARAEGCDTTMVQVDGERLTALALILDLKDRQPTAIARTAPTWRSRPTASPKTSSPAAARCWSPARTSRSPRCARPRHALAHAQARAPAGALDIGDLPPVCGAWPRAATARRATCSTPRSARPAADAAQFAPADRHQEFVIARRHAGGLLASLHPRALIRPPPWSSARRLGLLPRRTVPAAAATCATVAGERVEVLRRSSARATPSPPA